MEHFKISPSPRFGNDALADRAGAIRERLTSALRIVEQVTSVPTSLLPDQPVAEKDIRAILNFRRARAQYFDGELFADPAWDMLLELYAARLGQLRISVGALCAGAAVPATTALRWIATLESKGLVERKADPMDGRRFHLSLSDCGLEAMANYFRSDPARKSFT
ncbi:MAG: winged helix DNA-binding protein [Pseudomonadota bacterium]